MKLGYRRLSTGYHYVADTDAHHLFAQWRIGEELTAAHVSHNGRSPREIEQFIKLARERASIPA